MKAQRNLASVNLKPRELTTWKHDPNDQIRDILLIDSTVFAGGAFTNIAGKPRSRIAAFARQSGALTEWSPNVSDQHIIIGGKFAMASDQARTHLAAYNRINGALIDTCVNILIVPDAIINQQGSKEFVLYTNPTSQMLVIESKEVANYQIIELSGRVLQSGRINEEHQILPLYPLEEGLYFIKIGDTRIKPFIIQHQ